MTYRDRNGDDITFHEFCAEGRQYRVGWTKCAKAEVSTVWTGIDLGDGYIFETANFPEGDVVERYTTELDAIKGHLRWVEAMS